MKKNNRRDRNDNEPNKRLDSKPDHSEVSIYNSINGNPVKPSNHYVQNNIINTSPNKRSNNNQQNIN